MAGSGTLKERIIVAVRAVIHHLPVWKMHAKEASIMLSPGTNCMGNVRKFTRLALIHGLIKIRENQIVYEGSVESIFTLCGRLKKKEHIETVKQSPLVIPQGQFQEVQRGIIDRRRNKRTYAVMAE
jgi:hypothetical protein